MSSQVPNGRPVGHATELGEYRLPKRWEGSRVPGWDDPVDLTKDPSPIPDAATTEVPKELRAEIEALMAKYPDHRSASIPALAAAQRHHGWLPPEGIDQVACVMQITPAYLTAVASFYDMLDLHSGSPVRSRVYVCTNISCSLRGGRELLAQLESELAAQVKAGADPLPDKQLIKRPSADPKARRKTRTGPTSSSSGTGKPAAKKRAAK